MAAITVGKGASVPFNITPTIGVDVTNAYPVYAVPGSSATQTNLYYPENSNPNFALGTHIMGGNNTEFVLCVVATTGSINQYDLVAIDQNFNITQSYIASATAGNTVMYGVNLNNTPGTGASVAGIAASSSSVTVNFCWIALRGDQLTVNTGAAVAINNGQVMYLGTVPGTIGEATASAILLSGVQNAASVTAATTMAIIAVGPITNNAFL